MNTTTRAVLCAALLVLLPAVFPGSASNYLTIAASSGNGTPIAARHERRAVWIWGSTVRTLGAEAVARDLKQDGITDAIMLVKGTAGTVAYLSSIAPQAAATDTLQEFITACHARGIRVHAWLNYHQDDYFGKTKTNYKYTIWHMGKPPAVPYPVNDGRICPLRAGEEYNQYFMSIVQEILNNYAVDGIHLDYIRYPHVVYCFCPAHQADGTSKGVNMTRLRDLLITTLYSPADQKTYYNAYATGDVDVTKWVNLRVAEIDGFIGTVKTALDLFNSSHGRDVKLSAAVMPEGALPDMATDQARMDQYGLCYYAQKFEDMAPLVTFLAPMSYHKDYGKPASWVGNVAAGTVSKVNGGEVLSGIQEYSVVAKDVADALFAARWNEATGFAIFRFGYSTAGDLAFETNIPTAARLSAATEQFYSNGWIYDPAVLAVLKTQMQYAQTALANGNSGAARAQFEAYLNTLDAQKGIAIEPHAARTLGADAHWALDLVPPALGMTLTGRTGAKNARTWTFTFTNQGPGLAFGVRLSGLALQQTAGAACTPVIGTPLPVSVGLIGETGTATAAATLDFTSCPTSARFKVTVAFSANDGAISGSKTILNQIP